MKTIKRTSIKDMLASRHTLSVGLALLAFPNFSVFADIEAVSGNPPSAGWEAQQEENGAWVAAPEGVSFENDSDGGGVICWAAGYGGKSQIRIVKTFPPTTSDKVIVQFSFLPGAESVGGRLYFSQSDQVIIALQFLDGHMWVKEGDQGEEKQNSIDTGVAFEPDGWNRIEMRLNFQAHQGEVFLNGKSIGIYQLSKNATAVSSLNFFGGGLLHSSSLKGLSICSVESFTNESATPENK